MLRSIGVVLGGFIVMAIVVMLGTMAATAAVVPGGLATMRNGPTGRLPASYLGANLVISFLAAVLAGWLVTRFAASSPGTHVLALGALLLVMGVISAMTMRSTPAAASQPGWYGWVIPLVGLAGIAAGWAVRVTPS